jgi:chaperonin GroEL
MARKRVARGETACEALRRGASTLARALAISYGPGGGQVGIARASHDRPTITRDASVVARELRLADPIQQLGLRLLKDAGLQQRRAMGDGAATAMLLAHAMADEGWRAIAAGADPVALRRGIHAAAEVAAHALRRRAQPVPSDPAARRTALAAVAACAAQDQEIGGLVAEGLLLAGQAAAAPGDGAPGDGTDARIPVTVELGKGRETEIVPLGGGEFDGGYVSPYFITDFERREAVLEDAYVLVTRERISRAEDVAPLLESLLQLDGASPGAAPGAPAAPAAPAPVADKRSLLVVAEEITGDALTTLVANRLRGTLRLLAARVTGDQAQRAAALEDLCALTGATLIAPETGRRLSFAFLGDLGRAKRVVATAERLLVSGGRGNPAAIDALRRRLEAQVAQSESDVERLALRRRLARVSTGVVAIRVGGATEAEAQARKARVEKGLAAARAALEEGLVPGGGVALLCAAEGVDALLDKEDLTPDQAWGARILQRALEAPLRRLAENAGRSGAWAVAEARRLQREHDNPRIGFDALRGDFADLVERGVVDAARVARLALRHAASVAGALLTVEAAVVPLPRRGARGRTL